jgi:actin-related protein
VCAQQQAAAAPRAEVGLAATASDAELAQRQAERKRQEEERQRQVAEEAKRKAAEAKRKQEEEAKRKQEEEAKRQLDQEKSLLEQLAEMGFTDKQHNTSLLRQMRYDMDHALNCRYIHVYINIYCRYNMDDVVEQLAHSASPSPAAAAVRTSTTSAGSGGAAAGGGENVAGSAAAAARPDVSASCGGLPPKQEIHDVSAPLVGLDERRADIGSSVLGSGSFADVRCGTYRFPGQVSGHGQASDVLS